MSVTKAKALEPTDVEIRMRCIEAVAQTGVRESLRLVTDAKVLYDYVIGPRENRG